MIVVRSRLKENIHELSNKDDPGRCDDIRALLPPITYPPSAPCSSSIGRPTDIHIDDDLLKWHEGRFARCMLLSMRGSGRTLLNVVLQRQIQRMAFRFWQP